MSKKWRKKFKFFHFKVTQGNPKKCDKTPDGQEAYKTPGDNGFSVSVAGSPSLYRPGQVLYQLLVPEGC